MMNLRWEAGRQGTGYQKMQLLYSTRWMVDAWLLKSGVGVQIPPHTDPVPGYRHYRLNLILRESKGGGIFTAKNPILNFRRVKLFRSDEPHCVTTIHEGTRLVLSIGLCLRERRKP